MSVCLCVSVWSVGIIFALIPLLIPHYEVYSVSSMCVGLPLTTQEYTGKVYSVGVFVVFNFIIFLLIGSGQYLISKAKADMNEQSQMITGLAAKRRFETDLAIARQLSLVVISDFLCWFPIGVMGLMSLSGHSISMEAYAWSAIVIVPINSAINPLLYTVPAVRKKWAEFIGRHFKSRSKAPPKQEPSLSTQETSTSTNCETTNM